jgi:fatty-acyl-CoA synthase
VHIHERAALPKQVEVLQELPKTAVGKVFKPDLRRLAITRVYNAALTKAKLPVQVVAVLEDKKRGLVAQVSRAEGVDEAAVTAVLGAFIRPWEWQSL